MAELTSSSAYDIHIESVLLTSDRFVTEYELSPSVSEINIFENIDLPYLTGAIMLSDSRGKAAEARRAPRPDPTPSSG